MGAAAANIGVVVLVLSACFAADYWQTRRLARQQGRAAPSPFDLAARRDIRAVRIDPRHQRAALVAVVVVVVLTSQVPFFVALAIALVVGLVLRMVFRRAS